MDVNVGDRIEVFVWLHVPLVAHLPGAAGRGDEPLHCVENSRDIYAEELVSNEGGAR